jgi:hypothetical protein
VVVTVVVAVLVPELVPVEETEDVAELVSVVDGEVTSHPQNRPEA